MMGNVQDMSGSLLLQEFREVIMALTMDRENKALQRRADDLAVEIDRRMAW